MEPGAVVDHYTYVFRSRDLTLYGGVDAYRDTSADVHDVLRRVRDEYRPSVAFLPISRMTYHYKHGGMEVCPTKVTRGRICERKKWFGRIGPRWRKPCASNTARKSWDHS